MSYSKGESRPYIIITASALHILEHSVNEAIKEGYVPIGGVGIGGESLLQAMYKAPAKSGGLIHG